MIKTKGLSILTGYPMSDCANFLFDRKRKISKEKLPQLERIATMKHPDLILEYLIAHDGQLTMFPALTMFGIGALSQRVGEINRMMGFDLVVNIGERGAGKPGIYVLNPKYKGVAK